MYPWLSTAVFVVLLALLVYHATTSGTRDVDTWHLNSGLEGEGR
jgi:hypothetical protein